ncbi:MauE/DoxX family redox-associated membrane protein [Streptomyces sp. NBC_00059]|uniref:MauE/DoxX family redox-associated membrane protein n=1 Tax=Streptomyces sp. NBC_00059 TaxID=2975635 RepID=UPI00225B1B73|nr:MauE/DoxX family redox-associated membrane protein [Streptomyces sp. NBC_00059]MCX5414304.1 methylamine utilization protein MauE [Streptomyces sp. NBC_00059]
MTGFYGGLAASVVILTLLLGAGSHAASPAALGDALWAHGVLGPRLRRSAAVVVPVAEGALGVIGAAALLTGHQGVLQAVLAAGAALFGLYAGYTRHVLALGHGGPCGCSGQDLPLSRWVTRRAVALAVLATTGAFVVGAGPVQPSTVELVTLMLAASACTALLWSLPAAMHEPTPAPTAHLPVRAPAHDRAETVHRTAEGVPTRWTSPPAP